VTVTSAKGLFRLTTNTSDWQINEAGFYQISFGAAEAI
jgi:flagellar hook protein FlgE